MADTAPRRRTGGRAGRLAEKTREVPVAERAVKPGQHGGAYHPLTEAQMREVYDTALGLLEDVGMGSPIPEFVEVVTDAGGWMDEHGRLHYPRRVVEGAIATAAREFVWHGFDDDRSIHVGADRVHFGTAGAAVLMLDHDTNSFRESSGRDLYDAARVVDTLEHIHFFVRTVVPREYERSRDIDVNTAYAVLAGTSKPSGTSFFKHEHVYEVVDMFDAALGGEGRFRARPFVCANNTFVVPPLRFAEESAECIVAQVATGMPINLLSAGTGRGHFAGSTWPARSPKPSPSVWPRSPAVNLLNPGHPCVMGMWPFVSDLRTGAMSGGSPGRKGILNAAAAQLLNWIGLPSGVAAGHEPTPRSPTTRPATRRGSTSRWRHRPAPTSSTSPLGCSPACCPVHSRRWSSTTT